MRKDEFDIVDKHVRKEINSVLDKISAEIADIYCGQYCENPPTANSVRDMALEIIEKYKGVSK